MLQQIALLSSSILYIFLSNMEGEAGRTLSYPPGHTKDYKIGTHCVPAQHTVFWVGHEFRRGKLDMKSVENTS